jgi:hypothetical protein
LNGADDNVFSALLAPSGFIEHAIGFAYTGRIA